MIVSSIKQTYEIWPRLFLGRVPFANEAFEQDLLIHCETWCPEGVTCRGGPGAFVHGPFEDSSDPFYANVAKHMAVELSRVAVLAWREGKSVRISCLAGLNRSALVMGIVLLRLGLSPEDAIARIRWKRESDLTLKNEAFVQILRALDVRALTDEPPPPLSPRPLPKAPAIMIPDHLTSATPTPTPDSASPYTRIRSTLEAADTAMASAFFRIRASYPPSLRPKDKPHARVWDVCTPDELTFLQLLGDTGGLIGHAHQFVAARLDAPYQELDEPNPPASSETLSERVGRACKLVNEVGDLAYAAVGGEGSNEALQAQARFFVAWSDLAFLQERADKLEAQLVAREAANAVALAQETPADGS